MLSTRDTLCVLRLTRMGRLPPALYSTELLAEAGFPVVAIEYGTTKESKSPRPAPFKRIRCRIKGVDLLPKTLRSTYVFLGAFVQIAYSWLQKGVPRLVVAHGLNEQTLAFLLNKVFGVPYVVHVHEVFESHELSPLNRVFHGANKWVLNQSQFLIFPERQRAKLFQEKYQIQCPIEIVYNCPRRSGDLESMDLRKHYGWSSEDFLVGYFGGIGRENKLDDAIRAVARVPGTQLLIWGWGEREYIKELLALAKGVGASNQIHFLGELTEPRWKWLEGLDLSLVLYAPNLLRLQYAATASNKLFESLRCAVPVVTFAEPDFLEFLKDHPIGWSVQPGSVEELAHLFRRLRADRPLLEKTRQLARQFHLKEFNYEAQFQKLIPRFDSFFPDTVRSTHTVAA